MPRNPSGLPRHRRSLDELLRPGGRPRIIAHRGISGLFPENTLPSFAGALELGVDMIELDVLLSADRELVVLHDVELERTTDGRGRVDELTLADLKTLDAGAWFSAAFTGTTIPALSEVFALLAGRVPVNVEIKTEAIEDTIEGGVVERLLGLVREWNLVEEVLVSSFDERALHQARRLAPEVRRAVLYDAATQEGRLPQEILSSTGAAAFFFGIDGLTLPLLEQCRDLDTLVGVYTVNDPNLMLELLGRGVDALFTDRADLMLEQLRKLPDPS